MRFAYADPPYLGMCSYYDHYHPDRRCWDDVETHAALITRLSDEYPDGWAMSLHTPSLWTLLPLCPKDVRVLAWVKPFASFKPGVRLAYAWEPVILRGGRSKPDEGEDTVRDWTACNITLRRGFKGAKPQGVCFWLFDALGLREGDELSDLFHGSGAVSEALDSWRRQRRLA